MAGHSTHISKPKSDGQVATSLGRPTILEQPLVAFGSDVVADLQAGLRREWLVTNGLGGHASSTLVGINTRRYHGLLVAALAPPVERTVLVGDSVDWATTYDAGRYPLSSHEYSDGTIDPVGFRQLTEFRLEGGLPVWRFGLADAVLERRVWMAYGANTTYIRYQMLRASEAVDLQRVGGMDVHGVSVHLHLPMSPDRGSKLSHASASPIGHEEFRAVGGPAA